MDNLLKKLQSRKLWAMIVVAIINVLNEEIFHVSPDALTNINLLVMFYIGAEATVDVGRTIGELIVAFLSRGK